MGRQAMNDAIMIKKKAIQKSGHKRNGDVEYA